MPPDHLNKASNYYLLLELLEDGRAGLLSNSSPIPTESLVVELKRRTGEDFGDNKEEWARHFIHSSNLCSELERANLMIFLKTQEAMTRIWNKVKDN